MKARLLPLYEGFGLGLKGWCLVFTDFFPPAQLNKVAKTVLDSKGLLCPEGALRFRVY